jgi:hypothetical protein
MYSLGNTSLIEEGEWPMWGDTVEKVAVKGGNVEFSQSYVNSR